MPLTRKRGSPYVFREGNQSITEPIEGTEESEPSVDSDQEELDRFIAEIEDAADKEYEAEEAKEKEELGRIRYWNKEELVEDSEDQMLLEMMTMMVSNIADDSDIDSNSDGSNEARGRFRKVGGEERGKTILVRARPELMKDQHRHTEAKFRRNMAIKDSESEGMLSDVENAMWESDEEENDSGHLRQDHEGMWHSDAEEDSRVSRADRYSRRDTGDDGHFVKSDIHKRKTPKEADEAGTVTSPVNARP
ncbi:CRM-domain containing factor CFM3, chloroplastic/mitochondrial [Sesbania bispinosa]|nr:CRM-domain containing factor CFM3, chloroplastic/mitochondrial [Sesbania bispinosa]